jgi:hypothetical protein
MQKSTMLVSADLIVERLQLTRIFMVARGIAQRKIVIKCRPVSHLAHSLIPRLASARLASLCS